MTGCGGETGGEVGSGEVREGVSCDSPPTTEDTTHTHTTTNDPSTHKDKDHQLPGESAAAVVAGENKTGSSPYRLVFVEDLSSESSLAGSISPQNLETSGSFTAAPLTTAVAGSGVNPSRGEDRQELDENRSTVSSSTLVTESNVSCNTVETVKDGSLRDGGGEGERGSEEKVSREGGGKEEDGAARVEPREEVDSQAVGDRDVDQSEATVEERAESVTPPPKPKEHALSRLTSDSDVGDIPPFSPLEYHSSEDETRPGGQTPSFPVLTPSPLPPGTESPLEEQPTMSILFSGVFYLGSSTVDAPISETEANRKMNILHEQALTSQPMPIILSVPISNEGSVLLKDPKTDQLLTTFPVKMILFCVRGGDEALQDCFCFNVRHKRSGTHHCHVFRCDIMEAVSSQIRGGVFPYAACSWIKNKGIILLFKCVPSS